MNILCLTYHHFFFFLRLVRVKINHFIWFVVFQFVWWRPILIFRIKAVISHIIFYIWKFRWARTCWFLMYDSRLPSSKWIWVMTLLIINFISTVCQKLRYWLVLVVWYVSLRIGIKTLAFRANNGWSFWILFCTERRVVA